jgi:hypothetical protein
VKPLIPERSGFDVRLQTHIQVVMFWNMKNGVFWVVTTQKAPFFIVTAVKTSNLTCKMLNRNLGQYFSETGSKVWVSLILRKQVINTPWDQGKCKCPVEWKRGKNKFRNDRTRTRLYLYLGQRKLSVSKYIALWSVTATPAMAHFVLCVVQVVALLRLSASKVSPPHIVFILADDLVSL